MTHRLLALATGLFVFAASQPSHAGPHADARLLLHLQESDDDLCGNAIGPCESMNTESHFLGLPQYAYVIAHQANAVAGIGGVSFGIQVNDPEGGLELLTWTSCADNEVLSGGWPAPGAGAILTWQPANCQHVVADLGDSLIDGVAVAGYFYLNAYAPAQIAVSLHPDDSSVIVSDCAGNTDDIATAFPSRLGAVGFVAPGYNPCAPRFYDNCLINGPDACAPGTGGHVYVTDAVMAATRSWSISGQGTIVGPTEGVSSVTVMAGSPGTFTLEFSGSDGVHQGYHCTKTVTVEEPIPVDAVSWGRIKALYRSP